MLARIGECMCMCWNICVGGCGRVCMYWNVCVYPCSLELAGCQPAPCFILSFIILYLDDSGEQPTIAFNLLPRYRSVHSACQLPVRTLVAGDYVPCRIYTVRHCTVTIAWSRHQTYVWEHCFRFPVALLTEDPACLEALYYDYNLTD